MFPVYYEYLQDTLLETDISPFSTFFTGGPF